MSQNVAEIPELTPEEAELIRKYPHYYKDVRHLRIIDIYRVLELYEVTNQALGHSIKKLVVAGGRGGGKDMTKDVREACDTLIRWCNMRKEDDLQRTETLQHNMGKYRSEVDRTIVQERLQKVDL